MSPRKPFDINAQTDVLEPSNQPEQFQPPDNLFLQSESPNNDLEQLVPFVDTHQGSEPANDFLGIVAPENSQTRQRIQTHIDQLKKQLTVKRNNYIKGLIDENKVNVVDVTQNFLKILNERRNFEIAGSEQNINLLEKRMKAAIDFHSGILSNFKDDKSSLEQRFSYSRTLIGLMIIDNSQRPIQLPQVEKLPKYCTWVFLDRNQRMTDEQTIANRRRIYYDQDGEVCVVSDSDSDSDGENDEAEKKHFAESEDYILRMTVNEFGLSDFVVKLLAECFSRKPDDVQARYEYLMKRGNPIDGGIVSDSGVFFEKDLDAALDSFNKLFCRRCLIFDCKLHGCSQELIYPAEKQTPLGSLDAEKGHCIKKENCYLLACLEKRMDADCDVSWSPFEKSFLETGLQIFGRNSCLIAANFLHGSKTCFQIFMYLKNFGTEQAGDGGNADVYDLNKVVGDESTGEQVQRKSRLWSRKGKLRRLKYKPKSSGYPVFRKRIGTDDRFSPHYTPCGCRSPCGKDCGCVVNGTTCQKYCGCPRSCKKRFRGCHCAKNQCQTRHCPCYTGYRECDPDVCKNCWISCGDGTLGAPAQRGENHGCRNMKLLLRQQKKIALGKSDVIGWGAFLMRDVGKDEFIGEYTGEVISHYEAGKRGKRYDRINLSYLFDLDNQSVLDSYGMGDKLKFANHSSTPNCYPKVMLVAGDHRVGIYSKVPIKAGEEILYDYQFQPDVSPAWFLGESSSKKKGTGSKKKAARKRA